MVATRGRRPVPARARWARAAFLVVLPTLLVCVGMLEVGLRLKRRPPSSNTDGIFQAYGRGAYRLRPNVDRRSVTRSFTCHVCTNEHGFRDRAPGPRALTGPYLVWLGDSATFANGLDYGDSFVGRFGALASMRGIEVVNLAVGGHHISEQEDLLREFLAAAPRPPAQVILVFTPQMLALYGERYYDLMVKDGYLFRRHGWQIPYVLMRLGNASSAFCFFRDGIRSLQARVTSGAMTSEMIELRLRSRQAVTPAVAAELGARLSAVEALIRSAGARAVYVLLPTSIDLQAEVPAGVRGTALGSGQASHVDVLRRHCDGAGVPLVDLTGTLVAKAAEGAAMTFARDPHYNADVHRLIGRSLYEAILAEGLGEVGSWTTGGTGVQGAPARPQLTRARAPRIADRASRRR